MHLENNYVLEKSKCWNTWCDKTEKIKWELKSTSDNTMMWITQVSDLMGFTVQRPDFIEIFHNYP